MANFSNTQNVSNKPMKLGYQNHLMNARGSSGGRVEAQDPRGGPGQPNVYSDVDHEAYMRAKNSNGTGAGSGGASRSQNSRLAKTEGQTAGVSHTL